MGGPREKGQGMSTPGAMQRQPEDGSDPAPGALCKADATLDRLWAVLEDLTRHKADQDVLIELLGCGLHLEECRAEMRRFSETVAMQDALISFGRQLERQEQAAQAARPRHRHARTGNRPRLRLAGAAAVAAATAVSGGIVVHDDAAVQHATSAPLLSPAAMHAASLAPDSAVPFPSPSWSRRARQDAKEASHAPSPALAAPVVTVAPAQPSPSPQQHAGTLVADSTVLDLGVLGAGSVTLTAEGGEVQWSASQVPGLEVWPSSGVLQAGQSVTVLFRALDQSQSGFGIVDLGGVPVTVSWPAVAGLPSLPLP